MSTEEEPPAVIEARALLARNIMWGNRAAGGAGLGVIFVISSLVIPSLGGALAGLAAASFGVFVFGCAKYDRGGLPGAKRVLRRWKDRNLDAEFDDHERIAQPALLDERVGAAGRMANQIRALASSEPKTVDMVTRLESRLRRLVTDEAAARAAIEQLQAVGAAADGSRLTESAERVGGEIARILAGMSNLYAALLDADSDSGDASLAALGEVMTWLQAEAEVDEAMRPAGAVEDRQRVTE
jgi:hypothetical protein